MRLTPEQAARDRRAYRLCPSCGANWRAIEVTLPKGG